MSEFMPKINLIDREFITTELKEVAGRIGKFLFTTPEVHPYMSEHFRPEYPPEPLDGEAMTKQDTAAYYIAMAREAAE
jgi:hypothetical protein